MKEKICQALDEISDTHIAEAARSPARRKFNPWLGAMAAMIALAVLIFAVGSPLTMQVNAISLAEYPTPTQRPDLDDYSDRDAWLADLDAWSAARDAANTVVNDAKGQLSDFFSRATVEFLSGSGEENRVCSPLNLYMGLAALAEVTGGESRQQILDTLGIRDTEALRDTTATIWEKVYYDDGKTHLLLANSLWLDEGIRYDQQVLDILSESYYASVYQGDLGSADANRALRKWLNDQTGGLLKEAADAASFAPDTVLALASTVNMQAKWTEKFARKNNTDGLFHAPGGDVECTFMNKQEYQTYYYWGESYGAVSLGLAGSNRMWFILPDEGKSVDDVLQDPHLLNAFLGEKTENKKYVKVNLSLPIFDIQSSMDLREGLENMGILNIFDGNFSDFTTALPEETWVYISSIDQATRLSIDEDGLTAASYIVIPGATAAEPPEEIIDFVLDRPFLFVVTGANDLPLFTGVINQP